MNRFLRLWTCRLTCLACASCFGQTNAAFFFEAGRTTFRAGEYGSALANFSKAVEIDPAYADAYCNRGMTRWWLQDFNGAIADYDKAIALNPNCGGYYCNRGQAKFTLKMLKEALADYDRSIALDPKNAQAYFNRGNLKIFALTNYVGAVDDFTKALNLHSDPHEDDILFWRGEAKLRLKDYVGAIDDFNKCLKLNPENKQADVVMKKLSLARELLRQSK